MRAILAHPSIKDHEVRLILITPPAIDEYQMEDAQLSREHPALSQIPKAPVEVQRTAEHTRLYAEACREVGKQCGVTVLDLWSLFMMEVGWKAGEPLPGSKERPMCPALQDLLSDGMLEYSLLKSTR